MPYIETPEELVDDLADLFGVYGAHTEGTECPDDPRKMCRVCFTGYIAARIRKSVQNEADLQRMRASSMTTAKKERKHKPVRLRCTRAPKCPRGRWIDRDDLMPPGTAVCVQPCDRHVENGYYDLQTSYLDKDGKELSQNPDDWNTEQDQSQERKA